MSVAPNTKLMLTGAAILIAVVSCSVAITSDVQPSDPDDGPLTSAKIVENIRMAMNKTIDGLVPIHAYIIPSVDAHLSEFTSARDKRVQYVSGFTGSNAKAVITETAAALWTDSRYHAQAEKQLDHNTWTLMKEGMESVPKLEEWLVQTLPKNSRIGIDPFLITGKEFSKLETYLKSKGHQLEALPKNLVDEVWKNRPELKLKELEPIGSQFSGKSVKAKLAEVREAIQKLGAESFIVTALDDIAWLLNLRGSDLEYAPLFFSYVIIGKNDTYLYLLKLERATVDDKIDNHFQTEQVDIWSYEYNTTLSGIQSFIRTTNSDSKVILSSASKAIQSVVPIERQLEVESPIKNLRIIKNDVEAQGMREAHKRDGAAFIKYLYWLETEIDDQNITELKGAEKLKNLKSKHEHYRRLSFETISAVGEHAAMAHYNPVSETDKQITRNEIYLIDAGTQFKDGTTDVTRTIHFGNATEKEKDAFTRVLKGFIAVATAVFPPNAPYSYFDALARRALWDVGLNYNHGTGHGVGAYLNVHEYPPFISSRNSAIGMCKNMFTTNEPGYYEDNKFGVRIENVLQVIEAPDSSKHFGGKGAFKFEDVTMVPIQSKMINIDLLTDSEIEWLNQYHERVRSNISPLLTNNSNIIEWLERETKPISRQKTECNAKDEDQITTDPPSQI